VALLVVQDRPDTCVIDEVGQAGQNDRRLLRRSASKASGRSELVDDLRKRDNFRAAFSNFNFNGRAT
jgi:hypothetical protein